MTSRNMSLKNKPFLLKPVGKDYLWGGTRLKTDFGKQLPQKPLAETWECSTHPDGPSMVAGGQFAGWTLARVLREHPEYLGTHPASGNELPILIKLIDADKNLSVQVHPDDEYARLNENGSLGKSEMWYVLDAAEDARLVYGFKHNMDRDTLRRSLQEGTLEKHLRMVNIKKDDVFFIEAGTVHAIGAGALIAEIQESSNLTYRLYDYGRVDKNGKPRELHIDKALDVARLESSIEPRQPMRVLKYRPGCAVEMLCRCKYFQTERMLLNTETASVTIRAEINSFQVLLCVDGEGALYNTETTGECIAFRKGDCIFIPADSAELRLKGRAQLLKVEC
ncbi:MAG: class I mannose-6-phosphate isomerase [Lachnospiraceae bacterium]|nr:class I mannose-6-phosphate isomerase [Lachnospiraceae bacterium]